MYLKKFQVQLRTLVHDYKIFEKKKTRLSEISKLLDPHEETVSVIEQELVTLQSRIYRLETKRKSYQRQVEGDKSGSLSIDDLWRIDDELDLLEQQVKDWRTTNREAFKFYIQIYRDLSLERSNLLTEYQLLKSRLDSYQEFANLFCKVTYRINNIQETKMLVPFTPYGCIKYLEGSKFLSTGSRLGGLIIAQPVNIEIDDKELGTIQIQSVSLPDLYVCENLLESNMWFESFNFENDSGKKESARTYVLDHSYRPYFDDSVPKYVHGVDPARHRKGG